MNLPSWMVVAALVVSGALHAQPAHAATVSPQAMSSGAPATDGEVRKVDKAQGKITLRHGPIANLDMPGMTMVFRVSDAKMLDTVQPGDKVRFAADNVNGALTVTALEVLGEPAKGAEGATSSAQF
ncbi:copper-binding protein [Ideonella oryzae]|uniref:Copper-binding protein n=1 Tax=Ideonella oryzae TaxID=2937441 RepID=A0ABT1BHH5_9BURK|nr:copper-binding protein [Ideonella oryzae]MCO5975503.1 copper-binding protein [Ideonella oryzae]